MAHPVVLAFINVCLNSKNQNLSAELKMLNNGLTNKGCSTTIRSR